MPNYRVKLIIEGGKDDGKTKAERQARQQDPEVTGSFVDEVD